MAVTNPEIVVQTFPKCPHEWKIISPNLAGMIHYSEYEFNKISPMFRLIMRCWQPQKWVSNDANRGFIKIWMSKLGLPKHKGIRTGSVNLYTTRPMSDHEFRFRRGWSRVGYETAPTPSRHQRPQTQKLIQILTRPMKRQATVGMSFNHSCNQEAN